MRTLLNMRAAAMLTLVLTFATASMWSTGAHAGKFHFILGYNFDASELNSLEISGSTGGDYASTLELGGTYFNTRRNDDRVDILSFDIFSSLDAVQDYNFLFAAGAKILYFRAKYQNPQGVGEGSQSSFAGAVGIDLGYRFETGIPTALIWSLDYAPDLVTTSNLDELLQTSVTYEVLFTPIVIGHLSYRYGTSSFKDVAVPDSIRNFESSLGLGVKFRF